MEYKNNYYQSRKCSESVNIKIEKLHLEQISPSNSLNEN